MAAGTACGRVCLIDPRSLSSPIPLASKSDSEVSSIAAKSGISQRFSHSPRSSQSLPVAIIIIIISSHYFFLSVCAVQMGLYWWHGQMALLRFIARTCNTHSVQFRKPGSLPLLPLFSPAACMNQVRETIHLL